MEIERTEKVVGIFSEIAKVLAIIIGGIWVVTNFIWVDGPSRSAALSLSMKLTVGRWANDVCTIDVDVGVRNGSKQTVTVSATSLRVWTHTPAVDSSTVTLLNWNAVHALPPVWDLPQDQSRFNMTYEPGQDSSYSYTLFVPRGTDELIHSRLTVSSPEGGLASEVFAERTASLRC